MSKQPIATIVNFCSNEARFIRACLEQAAIFSKQVIVPICDHFFDGSAENRSLLEEMYRAFPNCHFVEYPFIPSKIPRKMFRQIDPAHFWHSCSRLIGTKYLDHSIESVLFLDADEVCDGQRFSEWLEASDYPLHTVMKLANYWYFREPIYRAKSWEDATVLVQVRALTNELLLHSDERNAIYNLLPGPKRRNVCGSDGAPMIHHYSWVRTRDEMLRKVHSWGHKNDRNWDALIENEFARPFQGVDFVHNYQYETVAPQFGISMEKISFAQHMALPQVTRLSQNEFLGLIQQTNKIFANFIVPFFKPLDFKGRFRR